MVANLETTLGNSLDKGLLSTAVLASTFGSKDTEKTATIQEDVIVKTNPADSERFLNTARSTYEVQPGDTIVEIAASFGISPSTIMVENNLNESSVIHPGQKLSILPTTGVTHKVTASDTLETLAQKYKVDENDLLDANDLELPSEILVGDLLVIPLNKVDTPANPNAAPKFITDTSNKVALKQASAPADLSAGSLSFIWPTAARTITQGFFSRHLGIDISNSRMVDIYAAEEGFVELSGYRTGYGNSITINHGNGYKTLYAHASELYASAGDHVTKGQVIAKQGRTGRVRGVTGIHLHFEIIKNGSRVNPLSYVKP